MHCCPPWCARRRWTMTSETERRPAEAYVWVWLPGAAVPVPAGRLVDSDGIVAFAYGRSYLARPDRVALYEPELPLRAGPTHLPPVSRRSHEYRRASDRRDLQRMACRLRPRRTHRRRPLPALGPRVSEPLRTLRVPPPGETGAAATPTRIPFTATGIRPERVAVLPGWAAREQPAGVGPVRRAASRWATVSSVWLERGSDAGAVSARPGRCGVRPGVVPSGPVPPGCCRRSPMRWAAPS